MSESAQSAETKRSLEQILDQAVEEWGLWDDGGDIVSIFHVGSTRDSLGKSQPTGEDNRASDIDLVVVASDGAFSDQIKRDRMEEYFAKRQTERIKFFLKPESQYSEPETHRAGTSVEFLDIHGWVDLAPTFCFNIEREGITLRGKQLPERLRERPPLPVPPTEGAERILTAQGELARGAIGKALLEEKELPSEEKELELLRYNNDEAKSIFGFTQGLAILAELKFRWDQPDRFYSTTRNFGKLLFSGPSRKKYQKLLDQAYLVKKGQAGWGDFTLDDLCEFAEEATIIAEQQAYDYSYSWNEDFLRRAKLYFARDTAGIVQLLDKAREVPSIRRVLEFYAESLTSFLRRESLRFEEIAERVGEEYFTQYELIAKTLLEEIVAGYPEVIEGRASKRKKLQRGQIYLALSQPAKAIKVLQGIISPKKQTWLEEEFPERKPWSFREQAQTFTNLGRCELDLGHIEAAKKYAQTSFDINPRDPGTLELLSSVFEHLGENEKAQHYKQISEALRRPTGLASLTDQWPELQLLEDKWQEFIQKRMADERQKIDKKITDLKEKYKSQVEVGRTNPYLYSDVKSYLGILESVRAGLEHLKKIQSATLDNLDKIDLEYFPALEKKYFDHKREVEAHALLELERALPVNAHQLRAEHRERLSGCYSVLVQFGEELLDKHVYDEARKCFEEAHWLASTSAEAKRASANRILALSYESKKLSNSELKKLKDQFTQDQYRALEQEIARPKPQELEKWRIPKEWL